LVRGSAMSADVLRRAATLMRECAEAATNGPWYFEGAPHGFPPMVTGHGMAVADTFDKPDLLDAKYIASMHPLVALAVAGWLDRIAWTWELDPDLHNRVGGAEALAVAVAYLGESDSSPP